MALVKASSSSSSSSSSNAHDFHVFLSFRGEETRKTFTDHLYSALTKAGFLTFRDDDALPRGEDIKPGFAKAIQRSRSSIIVFSKDYASSRWCLDELVMILERKRTSDHFVFPVFLDIDPSDLRNQTGSVALAFAGHMKRQSMEKLMTWKAALGEVADLAGMVLQNEAAGYEAKLIDKILKVVEDKLTHQVPLSVSPHLIGVNPLVRKINLWLQDGSSEVGILGICGIGGVGKTTIAQVVFNSNFKSFEGSSFIENIREITEHHRGLVRMQKQFLYDILKRKVKINNKHDGMSKIREFIRSKKILVILDGVDHMRQLDAIISMRDCFCRGSKIIITTRDASLLKVCKSHLVLNVQTLKDDESLELFSMHAFGYDHPKEGYTELSKRVVRHCGGLPLALEILGCSLVGQRVDAWGSMLTKLNDIPHKDILQKLRISYDSLDDDDVQAVFLHIACFFVGKEKDIIVRILDGCGLHTIDGIQILIAKSLLTIEGHNNLKMHDLIRDMGREIVRQESKELEKRSRLWHHGDSFNVLKNKDGSKKVDGLFLNMYMFHMENPRTNSNMEEVLKTDAFTKLRKLRLLHLSHVQIHGCYEELPKGLIWLSWLKFSLKSIPTDFQLENLVVFEMQHSTLKTLWKEAKYLPSLKVLDISHSCDLVETGDFSLVPNLERLILNDCVSLLQVHESIGRLEKLVHLNMSGCISIGLPRQILNSFLASIPNSLVELELGHCNLSDDCFPSSFGSLPSLERLNLDYNPISYLPVFIQGLTGLNYLGFHHCESLKSLIGLPRVIRKVDVSDCASLDKVTFQSLSCLPLDLSLYQNSPSKNISEIEYWYKLEPIGKVNEEMINLLSLSNSKFMDATICMYTPNTALRRRSPIQIQGLYEYGIFSTFLPGNIDEVPGYFSHTSGGESEISFTVPLSDHKIRGFNIFYVYRSKMIKLPFPYIIFKLWNKSKGLKWIYSPTCFGLSDGERDVICLSHWNLGNRIEAGDRFTASFSGMRKAIVMKEWGIQIVQEQEDKRSSDYVNEEVIGNVGDLSELYKVMPGTYSFSGGPVKDHREFYTDLWESKTMRKFTDFNEETYMKSLDHMLPSLKSDYLNEDERLQGELTLVEAIAERDCIHNSSSSSRTWRGSWGSKLLIMAGAVLISSVALISQRRKRHPTRPL